jgi:hypothetical protein
MASDKLINKHILFRFVELPEQALLCPITLRKSVLLLLLTPVFLVLSSVVSENCRMTLVLFLLPFLQQHKKKINNPTVERTESTATKFWNSVTFKTE